MAIKAEQTQRFKKAAGNCGRRGLQALLRHKTLHKCPPRTASPVRYGQSGHSNPACAAPGLAPPLEKNAREPAQQRKQDRSVRRTGVGGAPPARPLQGPAPPRYKPGRRALLGSRPHPAWPAVICLPLRPSDLSRSLETNRIGEDASCPLLVHHHLRARERYAAGKGK